jgi:hypothetical protein
MHMALVCYVSFSCIGILTRTENGPGTGLSHGNEIYVIRAIETWSLVNQSQEYRPGADIWSHDYLNGEIINCFNSTFFIFYFLFILFISSLLCGGGYAPWYTVHAVRNEREEA